MITLDIQRPNTPAERWELGCQAIAIACDGVAKAFLPLAKAASNVAVFMERWILMERLCSAGWWAIGGMP